jgi:hypothetical protein
MRRAMCTAAIVFLTASIILPVATPQSDPDATCRERLERLGAAITTYQAIHEGRKPENLSDLYSEGLIISLSDFVVPGSEAGLRSRADIDVQTNFTLAQPGDAPNVLVREKAPRAGRETILAATVDGNIRTIASDISSPLQAPAPSSGFQTGITHAGPAGSAVETPSQSGFRASATRAGPAESAARAASPSGFQVGATQAGPAESTAKSPAKASIQTGAPLWIGNVPDPMQASLLGTWVVDGLTSNGPPYHCMIVFGNDGAFSSSVRVDGKIVDRMSGAYRLKDGRLILMPEGGSSFDANMQMQEGTLILALPNFSGSVPFVRQAQPGGR